MEPTMFFGIFTGLGAAFSQSLCYLAARHYVQRRPAGAGRQLLVLGHLWMGIFSIILLPFVWHGAQHHMASLLRPLVTSACCYLIAQFSLLVALKHTEPSRVSPLLGFKIIVLAVIANFFIQPHAPGTLAQPMGLTVFQWIAVFLCLFAAIALNFSGAPLRRRAILAIVVACICYSISDWNITILVDEIKLFTSVPVAPFLATGLAYTFTGLMALAFVPTLGSRDPKVWRDALPWAALWYVAMLFLFTCFGLIGPLLGNILQSSRGLMSILLGSLFVYWGHLHIEPLHAKGVFLRRLASGVLMFLAVTLYVIRDRQNLTMLLHSHRQQGASHERVSPAADQPLPRSGSLARPAFAALRV